MRRLLIASACALAALAATSSPAAADDTITITSGPGIGEQEFVNAETGTWTWDAGSTTGPYECALVSSPAAASQSTFTPCTSPASLPLPSGAFGSTYFMVRTAGDTARASVRVSIDRTPPRASLGWVSTPFSTRTVFNRGLPSIPLSGNEMTMGPDGTPRNPITFRCSVDSGPWVPCAPENGMLVLRGLADGVHTVAVVARDLAGNEQAEPSTLEFEYVTTPATPVPMAELPTRTTARTISFQVIFRSGVDALAVCELDGRRLTGPCNAELKVEPGEHVYRVWAETAEGKAGGAFEWRWTVVDAPVVSDFRHVAPAKPAALRARVARCAKLATPRKRAACRDDLDGARNGALRFKLDEKARVAIEVRRENGKAVLAKVVVPGVRGANEAPLSRRLPAGRYTVTATAGKAEPVTATFVVR